MDVSSNEIVIPTIATDTNDIIIPVETEQLTPSSPSQTQTRLTDYQRALVNRRYEKEREKEKEKEKAKANTHKPRINKKKSKGPCSTYIRLLSGEEIFFNEAENTEYHMLLPRHILSCKLTRNIVMRIPIQIKERMNYLSKFMITPSQENKYPNYVILRDIVISFFYKEYKLRNIFKRLLQSWRLYRINKTYVPDIDLITLAEPQKPITIYDWTVHKKFVFDAKGLANSIQSSLLYYEGCFAMPKNPKNVMINTDFTFAQLVSIYYQLRERGELNWTISTMKKFNFSINRWKLYNKSQLYIHALQSEIRKLDTYDGRELFTDFIISKLEEYNLSASDFIVKAYENAVIYCPDHFYIQSLKPIVLLHYESQYFNIDKSNVIRCAFLKLHKNQPKLIKHMVKNGLI